EAGGLPLLHRNDDQQQSGCQRDYSGDQAPLERHDSEKAIELRLSRQQAFLEGEKPAENAEDDRLVTDQYGQGGHQEGVRVEPNAMDAQSGHGHAVTKHAAKDEKHSRIPEEPARVV